MKKKSDTKEINVKLLIEHLSEVVELLESGFQWDKDSAVDILNDTISELKK